MVNVTFSNTKDEGLQLLMLGAHCDDIEIGCGGTLLRLIEEHKVRKVKWVIFTSDEVRKAEAEQSANEFLKSVEEAEIAVFDYPDGFLPSVWTSVKEEFEKIKNTFDPDLIFTHHRNDLHQDHRIISELTWNTFRNHAIFEYEIAKYDGDLGKPNFFVPLHDDYVQKKTSVLCNSFKSQQNKQWFDDRLFAAVMRIRGIECASQSGYAEAFYNRKAVL